MENGKLNIIKENSSLNKQKKLGAHAETQPYHLQHKNKETTFRKVEKEGNQSTSGFLDDRRFLEDGSADLVVRNDPWNGLPRWRVSDSFENPPFRTRVVPTTKPNTSRLRFQNPTGSHAMLMVPVPSRSTTVPSKSHFPKSAAACPSIPQTALSNLFYLYVK